MKTESITITNNTSSTIHFVTIQDKSVVEAQRSAKHVIAPKEHLVIFTDRVESLHWGRQDG
jgi:hypothetical protein